MAIKKSFTTDAMVFVEDAYHRIENIMHPSKTKMVFQVRSYIMKSVEFDDGTIATVPHDVFFSERSVTCSFQIGEIDAWHQAYAHLKTMPEFIDAVDC